jgi:hypothetical protein
MVVAHVQARHLSPGHGRCRRLSAFARSGDTTGHGDPRGTRGLLEPDHVVDTISMPLDGGHHHEETRARRPCQINTVEAIAWYTLLVHERLSAAVAIRQFQLRIVAQSPR